MKKKVFAGFFHTPVQENFTFQEFMDAQSYLWATPKHMKITIEVKEKKK